MSVLKQRADMLCCDGPQLFTNVLLYNTVSRVVLKYKTHYLLTNPFILRTRWTLRYPQQSLSACTHGTWGYACRRLP